MATLTNDPRAYDPNEANRLDAAAEVYHRCCQHVPEDLPTTDLDGSPYDPYWPLAKCIAQQYFVDPEMIMQEAANMDQEVNRDSHGLEAHIPDVPDSEMD